MMNLAESGSFLGLIEGMTLKDIWRGSSGGTLGFRLHFISICLPHFSELASRGDFTAALSIDFGYNAVICNNLPRNELSNYC